MDIDRRPTVVYKRGGESRDVQVRREYDRERRVRALALVARSRSKGITTAAVAAADDGNLEAARMALRRLEEHAEVGRHGYDPTTGRALWKVAKHLPKE